MIADSSLAEYYAQRAREYDRIYSKPERQADLAVLRARVTAFAQGRRVLELACGTGWWTQFIAPMAECVTAVDINSEVLEIATQRVRRASVQWLCRDLYSAEPIQLKLGPNSEPKGSSLTVPPESSAAAELPEPHWKEGEVGSFRCDAENNAPRACAPKLQPVGFNSGFAAFWWSHVPRKRLPEFLTTFHRHLEPGASVCFLDNRYVPGSSTPISRTDVEGNTYQCRRLDCGETHEVLKNFPESSELERGLTAFGTNIKVELLEYYWLVTYQTWGPGHDQNSGSGAGELGTEVQSLARPSSALRAAAHRATALGDERYEERGVGA